MGRRVFATGYNLGRSVLGFEGCALWAEPSHLTLRIGGADELSMEGVDMLI